MGHVYYILPTEFKFEFPGTDSRLGWGFRLGNRAEIQVLVELGPQTNTQPLGVQPDSAANSRKRNTADTVANTLYAQRQRYKNNVSENRSKYNTCINLSIIFPVFEHRWR